jgi:hypothetical protein
VPSIADVNEIEPEEGIVMETKRTETMKSVEGSANRDPMSGAAGAHPVGVGTGAASGGIAGAVVGGVVGGPIGAGVGAVVGAVTGGLAGKSAAEAINPTTEHAYWSKELEHRPYYTKGTSYEQYGPAFQYGWESCARHKGRAFKDVEPQLGREWESRRGTSRLSWNQAKDATCDAWQRMEKADGCDSRKPG